MSTSRETTETRGKVYHHPHLLDGASKRQVIPVLPKAGIRDAQPSRYAVSFKDSPRQTASLSKPGEAPISAGPPQPPGNSQNKSTGVLMPARASWILPRLESWCLQKAPGTLKLQKGSIRGNSKPLRAEGSRLCPSRSTEAPPTVSTLHLPLLPTAH